jgi:hypothetical protein
MSVSVDEVMQIVRVTSAIVSELGLVQTGVRCDGRNVGFSYQNEDYDIAPVLFSLDKEALMYDDNVLSRKQVHTLIGIAVELELNYGEHKQFLKVV